MKKLLIYFPESKLAPKGGQAGYLYNLKKGFENDDCVRPEEFKPFVEKLYTKYRLEK